MDTKTTKEEMLEEWDWHTCRPTGRPVSRKEAHEKGIPHEGVHLWIIRNVNVPEILLQYRAGSKDVYPDYLDITVGGHVPFNMHKNKIEKETKEEIGIMPGKKELIDLGYYRYEEIEPERINREFQRIYLMIKNDPLDIYKFTDGEVEGIYSVPLEMFKNLLKNDINFDIEGYDGSSFIKINVSRKNFHPLLFAKSMKEYNKILLRAIDELLETGNTITKMPVEGALL